MDLLEYQGKQYFARFGVPVSPGGVALTPQQAVEVAEGIGYPVVVKAQVQVGGRGKAGGIKLAADAEQARAQATAILGMDIHGHTVRRLWVERASDIEREYYASFTLDRGAKAHLAMVSAKGGVDIEQVAADDPGAIARLHIDPYEGFSPGRPPVGGRSRPGCRGREQAAAVLLSLYRCFTEGDADWSRSTPSSSPLTAGYMPWTPRSPWMTMPPSATPNGRSSRAQPSSTTGSAAPGRGPPVRGPGRLCRDHRQRGRPGHEHVRRRQPGGRAARQFPGHRRRRQRRGDGFRPRGHEAPPPFSAQNISSAAGA